MLNGQDRKVVRQEKPVQDGQDFEKEL